VQTTNWMYLTLVPPSSMPNWPPTSGW